MANSVAAKKTKNKKVNGNPNAEAADRPLLDIGRAALKKLITKAKERGYITIDEINKAMPQGQVSPEQIEDTMTLFAEMDINVIDSEESEENGTSSEGASNEKQDSPVAGNLSDDDIGRTDDPVRMYLREMGSVELLSREGEIAIAKRIEAGREKMIGSLCESALTMRAIARWQDAIVEGEVLLRDIIDLDSTYGAAYGTPPPTAANNNLGVDNTTASANNDTPSVDHDGEDTSEDEETDDEVSVSLAAMEETLKPDILSKFKEISSVYNKLNRAQDKRLNMIQSGKEVSKSTDRTYERHRKHSSV